MVEKEHTARACCGRLCDLHGRSGNGRRAGPRAILACDLLTELVALPRRPPPLHAPYQTPMLRHILLSLAWEESWCGSGRRTRPAEGAATDWAVARLPDGVRDHSRSAASPHAGCGRGDGKRPVLVTEPAIAIAIALVLLVLCQSHGPANKPGARQRYTTRGQANSPSLPFYYVNPLHRITGTYLQHTRRSLHSLKDRYEASTHCAARNLLSDWLSA